RAAKTSPRCEDEACAAKTRPALRKTRPALRKTYVAQAFRPAFYRARSAIAWCSMCTFAASLDEPAAPSIFDASAVSAVLRCAPDCFSALDSAERVDAIASAARPFDRSS